MAQTEAPQQPEPTSTLSAPEENSVGDILKVITEKNDNQTIPLHLDQKLFVSIDFPEDIYKKHALTYKITGPPLLEKETAGFIAAFNPGFSKAYYFRFKPLAVGQIKLKIYQDPFFGKDIRCAEFYINVVE